MFYKKVDRHIVYDFISIKAGIKRLNKVNPPILFVKINLKIFGNGHRWGHKEIHLKR